MARPYKGRSGRIQARGAGGRFRQWTGEEFGIGVCPRCQHITVRPELPQTPFIDPRDFNARVCPGCGWDSRTPEPNPADPFQVALREFPRCIGGYDPLHHKTVSGLVWLCVHELDLWKEGEDTDIRGPRDAAKVRAFVMKYGDPETKSLV